MGYNVTKVGLNPYSIGRYSLRHRSSLRWKTHPCLNPYSIGRYSLRERLLDGKHKLLWS